MARGAVISLVVLAALGGRAHAAPAKASDPADKCPPVSGRSGVTNVAVTRLQGRHLTGKRVAFHLANATLVVDYAAFDAEIAAFLSENGAERFAFERLVRERLRAAFAKDGKTDEVAAEDWLPKDDRGRLPFRLATMLEKGAFEIRRGKAVDLTVYRLELTSELAGNRRFELSDCKPLLEVMDWIR